MNGIFEKYNELEYLYLSNFDISNINDMSFMFYRCYKLKELKGINEIKTNKVINMSGMFQQSNELEY